MFALALCAGSMMTAKAETTPLTAEMFHAWTSAGADAQPTDAAIGCAYELNASTGLPYGDGNVYYLNYADLSAYSKLVVTVSEGTPRFCLNRTVDGGQDADNEAESLLIDIPGKAWGTERYQTVDGNVYTIDLAKIVAEKGFAHLHCVKGAFWADVTVTSMELVTDEGDEEPETPEDETSNLTAEMFHAWTSAGADAQPTDAAIGCAYVLNASTGLPYGDGNVYYLNYADLSAYSKLIVTVSEGTPRFCLNRTVDGGQDADNEAESQLIDIPGKAWGTERYQTVDGNVYTIDLAKIVAEKGFAHLHCVKGAFWADVTVTSMVLSKGGTTGIETVEEAKKAEVLYDLQGRVVTTMGKGLFVKGGKVIMVK